MKTMMTLLVLLIHINSASASEGVYGYIDSINAPKKVGSSFFIEYRLKKISGLNENCTPGAYRYTQSDGQKASGAHNFMMTVFNGSLPVVIQYDNCVNGGIVSSPKISVNFFKTK